MTSSTTSPPAFLSDEWYRSIGGRRISIKEVGSILQQIREHQYPRFVGNVAPTRVNFNNPSSSAAGVDVGVAGTVRKCDNEKPKCTSARLLN